jgi:hypothetical protein
MVSIPLGAPVASGSLAISHVQQGSYRNLCWAACTAMVTSAAACENPVTYGNLPVTIDDVATKVIAAGLGGRCAPGPGTSIDRTCFPDCAINGALNLPCRWLQGTVEQQALLDQIGRDGHPPILLVLRSDNTSHVILLSAYSIDQDGTATFEVCDPLLESPVWVPFDQLDPYGQTARWEWTYVDVGPALQIG